jgi:hypothetical protein
MARTDATFTLSLADLPEIKAIVAALARVRLVHARNTHHPHYCVNCRAPYPCKTIRALDGDSPDTQEAGR